MISLAATITILMVQEAGKLSGHTREVSSLAVSPDGKYLASGSKDLTIRIWDAKSKSHIATLEGHDGEVQTLAFSPDGKSLASGEMYKKVKIWDTSSWKETAMMTDSEGSIASLTFSKDGKRIFAACKDNFVRVWTLGSSSPATKLQHNYAVVACSLTPDGTVLASFDDAGNGLLWDTSTLRTKGSFEHGGTGKSLAFSPNGKWIATGSTEKIKIWDASTVSVKGEVAAEANSLCFSPDSNTLMAGTQDNFVMFFDADSLATKSKFEKHERPVTAVCYSVDGKSAYSCSMDMTIMLWNPK